MMTSFAARLGIATDLYVATTQASGFMSLGTITGLSSLVALIAFWYTIPLYLRSSTSR
jgi:hypothetical protein